MTGKQKTIRGGETGLSSDKPEATKLGWIVTETHYPVETPWMRLRQDTIAVADGTEMKYTYEERAPAIAIVPVTREGIILLIRQYRYVFDTWCLEVPVGGTHDREGISLEEAARAELHEEIGGTCGHLSFVDSFYQAHAITDVVFHVFLATDVEVNDDPSLEVSERIVLVPTSASEALRLARGGQIKDSQSSLSLLLCEGLLQKHGYL